MSRMGWRGGKGWSTAASVRREGAERDISVHMKEKKPVALPKDVPDKLPGAVCAQYVRCGTPGCKCARGELHGPYFSRFWRDGDGKLRKEYVRGADVKAARAAFAAWRTEERKGRDMLAIAQHAVHWLATGELGEQPITDILQLVTELSLIH